MENLVLLHVGCANRYVEGFINSDKRTAWNGHENKLDLVMDLGQVWPYEDESVDGIVSMHVFQQLTWRELLVAFSEVKRVLKPGGVMRMGVPMVEIKDKSLNYFLGWNNINLFSFDLLKQVLIDRMGFSEISNKRFGHSELPELAKLDNRQNRGTHYIEIIK